MSTNISNYKHSMDNVLLFFAILTVDVFVLFLVRYFPTVFGEDLNAWYDEFQLTAVLSDVLVIFLGFVIARFVYTIYLEPLYGWNPLLFVGLLVLIQLIHDVLLYLFVILPIPEGHNAMIDRFKRYSSGGVKILVGDAVLMILSALVAFFYKSQPAHLVAPLNALVVYAMTYILHTKPMYL